MNRRNKKATITPACVRWACAIPLLLTLSVGSALAAGLQLPNLPGLPKLPGSKPAPAPAPQPAAAAAAVDAVLTSRPPEAIQALFAKGTLTGQDLVPELTALRQLMSKRRSVGALGSVLGPPDSGGGGFDPKAEAFKAGLKAVDEQIKPYIASIGFNALDLHLGTLIDDGALLASETIKLPAPKGLTHVQAQRVVSMAAMLVGMRLTNKLLVKARLDFANVEDDYTRLIERREAAAKVLYDLLVKGVGADTPGGFSEDELRYLREGIGRQPLTEFANDMGAQNLALRYLRATDAAAWGDYKGRSDGLRSSTKGYIRTVAGITAFAALVANFTQETLAALRTHKGADILLTMPFAFEFVKEVPPLLKLSWQLGAAGIVELPMKSNKRFRVTEGTVAEELRTAGDVFATVKKRNAEPLLAESLFRSGADGLLYKLYRCDKSEVGRMLDTAVPVADREKFAHDFALAETQRFSFANAFNAPEPTPREAELGDELLRKDHRERSEVPALGVAQRVATQGYTRWNNDQLLRLILANREGAASVASLQLGDVTVRPVPNMQSVYAYESLVDECAKQLAPPPPTAPAPTTPAPKPGAKPPPKGK